MTYKECVEKYLVQKREGDPIYTYEIAELLTTNFGMDKKKAAAAAALPKVSSMLDKLAKRNIIHDNKAANLKSKLARFVNKLA